MTDIVDLDKFRRTRRVGVSTYSPNECLEHGLNDVMLSDLVNVADLLDSAVARGQDVLLSWDGRHRINLLMCVCEDILTACEELGLNEMEPEGGNDN
jgi:hypothetical protein